VDRRQRASTGSSTSRDEDEPVPMENPESTARTVVLSQLSVGPRTRAQLKERLENHGIEDAVSEKVLDRFEELHLIDDAEFARTWVESRHRTKGLSRFALRHELRARGIDEETVQQALATVTPQGELEAAKALVIRHMKRGRGEDIARRVRRCSAMLARKGYGAETVRLAITDILGTMDGDCGQD
jgi:regulatory protein